MFQNRERRFSKMPGLIYPRASVRASCRQRGCGRDSRGACTAFTVVELLIVVVILSIVALTAVPMMSSAAGIQIRSAANMIAADVEYARSMAISHGQNFSVEFDKNADSYKIVDLNGNVIQHPVKKGFTYVVDFRNESRLNRVDITNANFNTTAQTVTFDCLGSPLDGGTVNLQAGAVSATITVEPVTGFVSIQ
ncbi:MAG TPA: GspH/FimT family protein [Sedimentisphaerales bacterium]|nr:GspH/FimT family protein [Sedimentisphaerales bacterium]